MNLPAAYSGPEMYEGRLVLRDAEYALRYVDTGELVFPEPRKEPEQ